MSALLLSGRGLHKSYTFGRHRVDALRGLDFDLAAGEMLAVTGPSGSGKSTLLNLAGLVDTPDAGELRLAGNTVSALPESERTLLRRDAIGFIFQGFNLVPVMSVADNIGYPLFLVGIPAADIRRRVAAMLERVGLAAHAAHRPDALSGGQRQRVAIARALIKRPEVVIADEPTANLDSATATQMLDLLAELCHADGTGCLIATHDARLTARCDRVLAMADGRLAGDALPLSPTEAGVRDAALV